MEGKGGTPWGQEEWAQLLGRLPHIPEKDVEQWGQVTTAGILAGMMYGGAREATATHAEFLSNFQALTTRFSQRELMEQRLVRIVRGTVRGGAQLGLVAGIFSAAELVIAAAARGGSHDRWSTAGAGAMVGAAMGLVGRGSLTRRIQASAGYSLTGAAIALPLGVVQDHLRALLPEPEAVEESAPPATPGEQVAAAIERLEHRLLGRAPGDREQGPAPGHNAAGKQGPAGDQKSV